MLAMFAGENRDDWDDLLPAVMMVYRSSVHEYTGFSPYRLMFGERQKHLYDKRAVRRLFVVGDWTMRYYPPAKKCKLDSPWVGPYLVVSLAGLAVGVQLQPASPIILVHCQDLKKIPHPSGLVSWIDVALPEGLPAPPILGVSTVCRSTQNSHSTSIVPLEDRTLLSGGASVDSGWPLTGSLLYNPEGSVVDVSSGTRGSVVTFLPQDVLLVNTTNSLHPFFVHRLDVGPIRLTSIAHAFNYRVAILRDGVKSAMRVGRSRRAAGRILEDNGLLWGHMDHGGGGCECLSSDRAGAYVHDLSLASCGRDSSPVMEEALYAGARDEDSSVRGMDFSRDCESAGSGTGHPGSVPFVSQQPGAYGRLFLAMYV